MKVKKIDEFIQFLENPLGTLSVVEIKDDRVTSFVAKSTFFVTK